MKINWTGSLGWSLNGRRLLTTWYVYVIKRLCPWYGWPYHLADYNKSPRTSPFKCGLPIDTMEDCSLSTMDQKDTTKRYQQIMGNLNWLSISTRLDLTCIHSLLSAYSHRPSKAHLWSSTLLVIKYCASNPSHWLFFSYKQSPRHKAFFWFPPSKDVTVFSDANWNPMDASVPSDPTLAPEQSLLSLCSISGWIVTSHDTLIIWGCIHHRNTSQSSCQTEVHSINEATKVLISLKLLFSEIHLPSDYSITIHNDNKGAVLWSKGRITKKMKWVDLQEDLAQENIINNTLSINHIPGRN